MAKYGAVERRDVEIRDNATFTMPFIIKDFSGAVVTLNGWTAKIQFRDVRGGTALATFTVGSGISIDGPNGKVQLKIQPATIQGWNFTSGWYDVLLTDTSSDKFCYTEGTFTVVKGFTQ